MINLRRYPFTDTSQVWRQTLSNHKSEKINILDGIKSQLIKMNSLKDESSETISQYCIDTVNTRNLKIPLKKCIAFCADNANTNFGEINQKGQNSIFFFFFN